VARVAISNSSPLIVLRAAQNLELLRDAFDEVWIPREVAAEIRDVPEFVRVAEVSNRSLVYALLGEMDLGEAAAVALAVEMPGTTAVLDDHSGRRGAQRLGVRVVGTLGLVLGAKREGRIASAREMVDRVRAAGLFATDALVRRILEQAGESD